MEAFLTSPLNHVLVGNIVSVLMKPSLYSPVLVLGAFIGCANGAAGAWPPRMQLDPISLLGVLLLVASAIADVPVGLGVGCFALWYAYGWGLYLGNRMSAVLLHGGTYRYSPARARRFKDGRRWLAVATATGRFRLRDAGVHLAALAALLAMVDPGMMLGAAMLPVAALMILPSLDPFGRPIRKFVWRTIRREYRSYRTRLGAKDGSGPGLAASAAG